jgi:signal transduction histidine kinase
LLLSWCSSWYFGGIITSTTPIHSELDKQIRKSALLHTFGGALFIASTVMICVLIYKEADQTNWVNHTYEVRNVVNQVRGNVQTIESASRGYAATRDTAYLKELDPAVKQSLQNVQELRLLTLDNPRQQTFVARLLPAVQAKVDFNMKELIPALTSNDQKRAREYLVSEHGRKLMDMVQSTSADMLAEESRLLDIRHHDVLYLQFAVFVASTGLSILALITLFLSFRSSKSYLQKQEVLLDQAKAAEHFQRKISQQLERSNKDLQQFAYVASHDLQEPLRAVGGFLSLISERFSGKLGEQGDKWIQQAVDGAERMRVLINDLLTFARVDTRGGKMEQVDCAVALKEALDNLAVLIDESGALIEIGGLPKVTADKSQLTQVFQNLIANSIKYRSEEAPHISIDATLKDKEWQFTIKDNGIGFDMAHAERIFIIFQRLHTRAEYAGTGIGLALCSRIIERHGGRIWATSEVGKGSTFCFTLPKERKQEDTNEIN